ncbi:MAG: nitroreductase family protein [Candidatus Heimdallarchaeota archaeon]
MKVQEAIIERRSIRKYSTKPVSDDLIMQVLEAGRWAPSSDNSQPWEFIVIRDQNTRNRLSELSFWGRFLAQAPVAIAIVTDPHKSSTHIIDGACVTQNMMLAAWELGLGTCWIANLNTNETKRILGIPNELYVITVTPLGFPKKSPPKPSRKDIRTLIHRESY